jgi:hypothetical protein
VCAHPSVGGGFFRVRRADARLGARAKRALLAAQSAAPARDREAGAPVRRRAKRDALFSAIPARVSRPRGTGPSTGDSAPPFRAGPRASEVTHDRPPARLPGRRH